MNINVEFLSREPLENVITNLNYKVEKVIYFGFEEEIQKQRRVLIRFLKDYCGVKEVIFQSVSHYDMDDCIKMMRKVIQEHRGSDDHIYFDLTGGESFIMTGFGILATEIKAPLHVFDVEKNRLHEMREFSEESLERDVTAHRVEYDIDKCIQLHGGSVNHVMHKSMKDEIEPKLVDTLWEISTKYQKQWNDFSAIMRCFAPPIEGSLSGNATRGRVDKELKNCERLDFDLFKKIAKECMEKGLISDLNLGGEAYAISYPSELIKDYLWDGGAILEIHTREVMKRESDYCEAGVHIDWDGKRSERDVLNEIDVIAMKGNIPIFISCKNGRLGKTQSLHALYELDTVTSRFGGKYAKMIMIAPQGLYSETDFLRAEEMGIEVRAE